LDHDYFWSVPLDAVYEVTARPGELTIGSLTDDLNLLASMTEEENRLNYGLVWVGDVFRALGAQAQEWTDPRS
jgi:hypothetical protein